MDAAIATAQQVADAVRDAMWKDDRASQSLGIEVLAVGTDLYDVDWVVSDVAAVADELSDIGAGDAVLVKGSRVAGLERVATELARRSG